jgi:hypothetical protein
MIPPVYLSGTGALYAAYHPALAAGFAGEGVLTAPTKPVQW